MANRGSPRARARDTSPGRWLSHIPSTLSPDSRLVFRPWLNPAQTRPPSPPEESRWSLTSRDIFSAGGTIAIAAVVGKEQGGLGDGATAKILDGPGPAHLACP